MLDAPDTHGPVDHGVLDGVNVSFLIYVIMIFITIIRVPPNFSWLLEAAVGRKLLGLQY